MWYETLLWLLLALTLEKWLDYVERPRWLRRKAKRAPKTKQLVIIARPPKPKQPKAH